MKKALVVLILTLALLVCFVSCDQGVTHGPTLDHTHDFGEWSVTKNATCTEDGIKTRYCDCGERQSDTIPANGHNYADGVCVSCGDVNESHECKHTTLDVLPAKEATCAKTGLTEGKKCADCGDILISQQVIPIVAHTYDDKYDENCNVCGYIRDVSCAHRETEIVSGYDATCTSSGLTNGTKCKECGEILMPQTVIDVKEHTVAIQSAVEATCTSAGLTEGKHCSMCGAVLIAQEIIDATGHSFGEWVTVKEPTLEENGEWYRECANCSLYESCSIPYVKGISSYGYHYFANETNGTAKQKLYMDLYYICEDFANNDEDLNDLTLSSVDCDTYGLTLDEAISVWKILLVENPRYYWLSNNLLVSGNSIQVCVDEAYATANYRKECDAAIESMAADCGALLNAKMSELEKALAIHNFILNRMNYAYESDGTTPEDAIWAHNMIGCAKYNLGVCESYVEAYMYLCLLNGIDCIIAAGEANNEEHTWNLVSIDGKWYGVDCTWDETNEEDKLSFNCFGMSKSYTESIYTVDKCTNSGIDYLYALPEISERSVELVDLYKEDSFIGTFANIDAAFDEMTGSISEYSLYLYSYDSYGVLLISSPNIIHAIESETTPKVKKINIYGTYTSIGDYGFNTSLYINNKLISFTETILINGISIYGDGSLNIQDNCLFIEGEFSYISVPIIGNIENNSSSKIVCNTTVGSVEFYDFVQVHTMIVPWNVLLRDNAKIVDLRARNLKVMGYGGTVEIENLYGDYEYCTIEMDPGTETPRLIINNLYSSSEDISAYLSFGKIEEYPYLLLGNMNCEVDITLSGEITHISTDVNGETINRWTESCSPIDVTAPIVMLTHPEQFQQTSISIVINHFIVDYTHLYQINEENEVVLKEYELVNGCMIMDDVVVYYIGDLKDVVIPKSAVGIGDSAFFSCTSLTSVTIGDNVTSIGDSAFFFCPSLTSVTIGDNVTSIGDSAFFSCTSLTSITFKGTVERWNEIEKVSYWNYSVPATKVICFGGTVPLE